MKATGALAVAVAVTLGAPLPVAAQDGEIPPAHQKDRGPGLPTSMFGTYVRSGELLVYPFFEYYRDEDFEYKPEELGVPGGEDFRGRYRASEGLLFVAYGISDRFAVEVEAAVISARLDKSPADPSILPARMEESGLGDVEGQLRWRWREETEARPELFGFTEVVVPHQKGKPLIGTADWELKIGSGMVRGYPWGTLTVRAAAEIAEGKVDTGEYAVEYLKRLSPRWRVYAGVEGTQDEVELITEVQLHLGRRAVVKIGNGFGITSKATDWAPEVGVMFSVPTR